MKFGRSITTACNWRLAHTVFLALCVSCDALLFIFDRKSAYISLSAFAYGLILWLITRSFIRPDAESEETALRTVATSWRLALRVVVVAGTFLFLVVARHWFWNSTINVAIQHLSATIGMGYGDTAVPNVIFYVLVPGALLFLLGASRAELGLTGWRKGSAYALLGALVLPLVFAVLWFSKGRGTAGLLLLLLLRNFLSNGFSEEFLMRSMMLSHLRAFVSKDWAVVGQAILFGLFHLDLFTKVDSWALEIARVIAMNAPMGFFLALIALRARSVVLPGLIHTTLDTMISMIG